MDTKLWGLTDDSLTDTCLVRKLCCWPMTLTNTYLVIKLCCWPMTLIEGRLNSWKSPDWASSSGEFRRRRTRELYALPIYSCPKRLGRWSSVEGVSGDSVLHRANHVLTADISGVTGCSRFAVAAVVTSTASAGIQFWREMMVGEWNREKAAWEAVR